MASSPRELRSVSAALERWNPSNRNVTVLHAGLAGARAYGGRDAPIRRSPTLARSREASGGATGSIDLANAPDVRPPDVQAESG